MSIVQLPREIMPNPSHRKLAEELSGERIPACFQCEKCTNGCPVAFAMDLAPHIALCLLHLGLVDEVLRSDTIWVCASCETRATRCPNDINITRVMDTLRQLSRREDVEPSQRNVPPFHTAFLSSIRRHGRVHETEMAVSFILKGQEAGQPGRETHRRGRGRAGANPDVQHWCLGCAEVCCRL